jgi:hypothetical protein
MQRWLFLLFLLCITCYKASPGKTAGAPMIADTGDVTSWEQRLDQDMQSLGLSTELLSPPEVTPPTTLSLKEPNKRDGVAQEAQVTTSNQGRFFQERRNEREAKKLAQLQCQDTCRLVTNICNAAERICQLTAALPDDPDSPKRCERAKNSCSRAKKQGEPCGCGQ